MSWPRVHVNLVRPHTYPGRVNSNNTISGGSIDSPPPSRPSPLSFRQSSHRLGTPFYCTRLFTRKRNQLVCHGPPTRYCFLVRRLFAVISSRDPVCDTNNPRVIGIPFIRERNAALEMFQVSGNR